MHRTTQRSQPPGGTTRKQNPAASSYPRDNNGQTHRRTWAPNKETQPQKAERPLAATLPQGNRPHPKPPHNRQTYNERPQGSRKVPTSTARRERGGPPRRGHERTGEGKEQGTEPTGHRSSENGHTHKGPTKLSRHTRLARVNVCNFEIRECPKSQKNETL